MVANITAPRVGLFTTCLVDMFRPTIGFAAVKLLEGAGCVVEIPESQTCCGQPAYNNGDIQNAQAIARQVVEAFHSYDYVVAPSGSCASTIRHHYPRLLADDPSHGAVAADMSARVFELTSFLTDVLNVSAVHAEYHALVTYHDSCSGRREMGVSDQPRALLRTVKGLTLVEAERSESCCGFGGTFSIKYANVSDALVSRKTEAFLATSADVILGGDLGCLMHIAGKLSREGSAVEVRHVAEVLAGMTEDALPIGAAP
jgi:L-lactate dehydrogenase complex protein LldE